MSPVQFTAMSMPRVSRVPEFTYGAWTVSRSPVCGWRPIRSQKLPGSLSAYVGLLTPSAFKHLLYTNVESIVAITSVISML